MPRLLLASVAAVLLVASLSAASFVAQDTGADADASTQEPALLDVTFAPTVPQIEARTLVRREAGPGFPVHRVRFEPVTASVDADAMPAQETLAALLDDPRVLSVETSSSRASLRQLVGLGGVELDDAELDVPWVPAYRLKVSFLSSVTGHEARAVMRERLLGFDPSRMLVTKRANVITVAVPSSQRAEVAARLRQAPTVLAVDAAAPSSE